MRPPAEGVVDLYSRRAREFDADRSRTLFERPWLDAFLACVPEAGTVLDLGCGSGEPIARHLIDQGRKVTGVDASPGLVELCRRRFPGHDWQIGDMRAFEPGRLFDGVVAWHSLIHLAPADQPAMFGVFARCLRPGGPLLFTSGSERGETIGEWCGEALYHGSLSLAEYRSGLEAAGFDLLRHVLADPDCGGATVWLARRGDGKVSA